MINNKSYGPDVLVFLKILIGKNHFKNAMTNGDATQLLPIIVRDFSNCKTLMAQMTAETELASALVHLWARSPLAQSSGINPNDIALVQNCHNNSF